MKTNIKNILKASLLSAFAFLSVGCNTDPEYHSTVAPEIFFTTQETVWQRFSRPLTHWKWHFATDTHRADAQSLGTDELAIPTKGTDWYDGGQYQNMHWHDFRPSVGMFHSNFYGVGMGVALAYDALEDIDNYVDFEALKFADPEGTKQSMISQLNVIIAHLYMDGLDQFGGMNIYTREEAREKIVKGRATDVETFEFVEKLLKENIPNLPKKESVNESETSMLKQAFGAALLAQLYFNAVPYTKGAKGEIVGLAGVDGNGQTELCEILSGVRKAESGTVTMNGRDILNKTPKEIFESGLSSIPADRQRYGLVLDYSIENNMVLQHFEEEPFSRRHILNKKEIHKHATELMEKFDVRPRGTESKPAGTLSGGNQQKVIIAREITNDKDLLIAVNPTRGLDVGAIEFVHKYIVEQRNKGKAVLLVSFELDEIMSLSDRIEVIFDGRINGSMPGKGADEKELGFLMAGGKKE